MSVTSSNKITDTEATEEQGAQLVENDELKSSSHFDVEGGTSSTNMILSTSQRLANEGLEAGNRESKVVFWLKLVLLGILCACTVGVAVGVYFYTTDEEQDEFENRYKDGAAKVLEAIGSSLYLSLGALDSFAVDTLIFSHSLQKQEYNTDDNINATLYGDPWPFVTVPHFAVRAAKLRILSHAFIVMQYNFVPNGLRQEWEEYSFAHDGWVKEAMDVQKEDPNYHGPLMDEYTSSTLYTNYGDVDDPGPYLPSWQSYPMVPIYPPYNWDGFAFSPLLKAQDEVLEEGNVVIRCSNLPSPDDAEALLEAEYTNDWASGYISKDADPAEPQIEVYYPLVLESHANLVLELDDPTVVAVLAPTIFWRELISGILPDASGGVDAVFKFGESIFTYNIKGPTATYLGQGDRHDTRFGYLEQCSRLLDLAAGSTTYMGRPLSEDMANYTIHIYPSPALEDSFTTSNPGYITALTVLIFAFTSAVFLVYDRCVEKRQRKIVHTAIQSREDVFLLDQMVKERTSRLEASNIQLEEANRKVLEASQLQLQHFACMGHEIRTPLNCIVGVSSLMEESDGMDPQQLDSMRMIVSSCDLLRAVVDDVLDYAKLETGNVQVDMKESNLQQTLSSVVHSVEMRGLSTDVSLRTNYDPLIPEFVQTDTRRVQQILYNLLGNAVKFSKNGGTVDLELSICPTGIAPGAYSPPPPETTVLDEPSNTTDKVLRFVVTDYGKGIDKVDYNRIFQPFIQTAEKADNENIYGGTGLGLPITVKLIHGFGGSISVESQKGEWTKFTADLPFHGSAVDTENIAAAANLHGVPVVLITNDFDTRQQIGEKLLVYGIQCITYANMNSMDEVAQKLHGRSPSICVIQEDLFDKGKFKLFSKRVPSALITFGPSFVVRDGQGHHRSLTKMLPSALITSMSSSLKSLGKASSPALPSISSSRSSLDDASVPYRSLRCLIAEDNMVNQKVLKRMLDRLEVLNVEIVDNGQKAVDREAETEFDLILMDMQMPVMDGVDACRLINERQGGHRKAKVVFVTAHVQENVKDDCLRAGAVGYLAKPCNIKTVESCLQKFVNGDSAW